MLSILSGSLPLLHGSSSAGCQVLSAAARLLPIVQQGWHQQQQQQVQHHQLSLADVPQHSAQHQQTSSQRGGAPWQQQLHPLVQQHTRSLRTRAGSSRPPRDADEQREHHSPRQQQAPRPWQQWQQRQYPPDAAELTALIHSASSPRELLERVVTHHAALNHTHIIGVLQTATQLWPQTAAPAETAPAADQPRAKHIQQQQAAAAGPSSGDVQLVGRQQLQKLMLQLCGPYMRALPDYSARDVTAALWCFAKCGLQPPAELIQASLQELCSWDKVQRAQPHTVAHLAWAAAKLGCRDKQLFSHIAMAALSGQMQHYTPPQLSTLAWAFSRAGYTDLALGQAMTAAAVALLQQHLQVQEQLQQQPRRGRAARQAAERCFTPYGLATTVSSAAGLGWLSQAPELTQLAVQAAPQEPFVYGFRPMDAANFLWGLATALHNNPGLQPLQQQQSQHPHASDANAAASAAAEGETAAQASSPGLDPQLVWQSSLGVAAAALRRVEEGGAGSLCRMVWSTAILSQWVHKQLATAARPPAAARDGTAAAAAGAAAQAVVVEGAALFGQLCTALGRSWQQQPQSFGQSAAMTAWGLVAADKSGLWSLVTPCEVAGTGAAADTQQQQQQPEPPTLLLQHLLEGICASCGKGTGQHQHHQQQLSVSTVGDLAVALAELKPRVDAFAVWSANSSSAGGAQQQEAAGEGGTGAQQEGQQDSLPVQLQAQVAAAVDALAAAAWQHAGNPGELEVRDVSRMLSAFCHLQVDDAGLYRDLLQHWGREALQGCSSKALVGALHAASVFTAAQSDWMQSGSLPTQPWEHLLAVCVQRWGGLSAEERRSVTRAVQTLCGTLKGVVSEGLLLEVSEVLESGGTS